MLKTPAMLLLLAVFCTIYCEYLHEFFDDQWLNGVNVHVGVWPGDPDQRQNINAIPIRDAIKGFLLI